MKKTSLIVLMCLLAAGAIYYFNDQKGHISYDDREVKQEYTNFQKKHLMLPGERYKIRQQLTFKEGGPNYKPGYQQRELKAAMASARSSKARLAAVEMEERGPSNVPGRARGLVVLPQDETHQTWLVGSSGGGIWKTTDGGASWTDKSAGFPSLAVTSIAYCESQPNTIYAGTGEYVASAFTAINGDGVFKSTDAGETWTQLSSTAGNDLWQSVTRIIVDPNNPDIVLASTAPNTWGDFTSNIMKSTDGGQTWNSVFESNKGAIEQIIASPDNFSRIYAGYNGAGVLRSDDAGDTWQLISSGMTPSSRVELAISPVNTSRLYASVVGDLDAAQEADIYYSDDAGENWTLITDDAATVDVLGGQGWYDNTILAHPFNQDEFYVGGIGIYKYTLDIDAGVSETEPNFLGIQTGGTEAFMARVNFAADLDGGMLATGSAPAEEFTSVELRFGPGLSQKAHRFTVPEGRGSGVADSEYTYEDYVDVPFQAWDVDSDPPRQLMVAFRDQQRDGVFNLIHNNTEGDASDPEHKHSREYVYINSRTYDENFSEDIARDAGHIDNDLFFIWPYLVDGATWDPENLPQSSFKINWGSVISGRYTVESVADPYGDVDQKNSNVHPDHHNMVAVIHNGESKEWQIVEVNDGASYASDVSTEPGLTANTWSFAGSTMNTTQFYGADKAPGVDRYVGGAQDNGSWVSPAGEEASKTTEWSEGWGGDGFGAVWHWEDINRIIVTSQNLNVARSTNGGETFASATNGLEDSAPPFIGQFANAPQRPDVVFTIGSDGIYKSENFGGLWKRIDMTSFPDWVGSSLMNIEISEATPDIMWAGAVVQGNSGSIFVSTDAGNSFNPVPDPALNDGYVTGIATHPVDHETVYILFSYADSPKVIRSTDLGQTWEDISGFSTESSSTGFPDVAVYDLVVMPHDPNTIWVGSEIGIIESNDNGASWHLLETDMPQVAVWQIKLKEDQLVLATHGRGIWTYTLPEVPVITYLPEVKKVDVGLTDEKAVTINFATRFDSAQVFINETYAGTILNPEIGENVVNVTSGPESKISVFTRGFRGEAPFTSDPVDFNIFAYEEAEASYVDQFTTNQQMFSGDFKVQLTTSGFNNGAIQSDHDYKVNGDYVYTLKVPITIKSSGATFSYNDVAIVEPGADGTTFGTAEFKDYVIVEGSTDGLTWIPLGAGYDASFDSKWLDKYNSGSNGSADDYVAHEINLLDHFNAGDKVVFRFRLHSDEENTAWGWAIDDLNIQGAILGFEEEELAEVSIYPNPATSTVTIQNLQKRIAEAGLYSLNGIRVPARFDAGYTGIDVSGLAKGIYVLNLKFEDGSKQSLRVLKN